MNITDRQLLLHIIILRVCNAVRIVYDVKTRDENIVMYTRRARRIYHINMVRAQLLLIL